MAAKTIRLCAGCGRDVKTRQQKHAVFCVACFNMGRTSIEDDRGGGPELHDNADEKPLLRRDIRAVHGFREKR